MSDLERIDSILTFWFGIEEGEIGVDGPHKRTWFGGGDSVDREIAERFGEDLARAERGELDAWADQARHRLALVILLDQFSRNVYRGSGRAFSNDEHALRLCLDGIQREMDRELHAHQRMFFYLPLEHSESEEMQQHSVNCFTKLTLEVPPIWRPEFENYLDYAVRHRDIVARFGRFPHRNALLGRESTEEEIAFLAEPGSSFG